MYFLLKKYHQSVLILFHLFFFTFHQNHLPVLFQQKYSQTDFEGFFHKMYNKVIDKRNKEVEMHIEDEESVKELFTAIAQSIKKE